MADELGNVSLGTEVSLDGLRAGMEEAKAEAEAQAGSIAGRLSGVLSGALAGAGVAVAGALIGAGAAAVDMASQANQATNDIQAQLGLTRQEAEALTDVALDVFGNNFGGSVEEAAAAVAEVRTQIKGIADEDLQSVTEGALALSDVFEVDVAESANAAQSLMTAFGLSSEEALDFIAKGFQSGLNSSDDFLDSVGEYAVQFQESGATADEFFSVMQTGLQGGVLGTDKLADAFKESRLRIMEMSDDVVNAFTMIGDTTVGDQLAAQFGTVGPFLIDSEEKARAAAAALADMGVSVNADDLLIPLTQVDEATGQITTRAQDFATVFSSSVLGGIESGTISVADAQRIAIDGLGQMDNAVWQNTAGVAIFGTQWEDAGATAILNVDMAATSMADMAGATDSLNAKYTSLGAVGETMWRQLLLTLMPVGQALLDLANAAMPVVMAAFSSLQGVVQAAVDAVVPAVRGAVGIVSGLLSGEGAAGPTTWGAAFTAVQSLIGGVMAGIQGVITPILAALSAFWAQHGAEIQSFAAQAWQQIGAIVTTATALIQATIVPILTAVGTFIGEHGTEIQTVLTAVWTAISAAITAALAVIQGVIAAALAVVQGDWSGAWTAMQTAADTAMTAMHTAIESAFTALKTLFETSLDGVVAVITGLGKRFTEAGTALIGNLKDGFFNAIDGLVTAAKDKLKELTDLLPGSEPKDPTSPLAGLAQRGQALVENFQAGIDATDLNLRSTLDAASGDLIADGAALGPAGGEVRVVLAGGADSWLRNLIQVEVRGQLAVAGRSASIRAQS